SVMVEAPFGGVAVDIIQAPGVRLFLADRHGLLGVVHVPGVVFHLLGVVPPEVGGLGACAAGVFPFGFRRKPIDLAGLFREPATIFHGRVMGDANGWLAATTEAEG